SPTCDLDTRTSDRRRTDPLRLDASWPPAPATTTAPVTRALPAPTPHHPLLAARVKDASGVATRSTTSLLDPTTHPRSLAPIRGREHTDLRPNSPTTPVNRGQTMTTSYPHLTEPFHISGHVSTSSAARCPRSRRPGVRRRPYLGT